MPNWAYSKVTIVGDHTEVATLKHKLAEPYADPHNPNKLVTGEFLLWNIVKPSNLSAYVGDEGKAFQEIINADPDLADLNKPAELPNDLDTALDSLLPKILYEMATSDSWYEWNCRNWGTKWEVGSRAVCEFEMTTPDDRYEITYRMETAWSPPFEALAKLAEQYPSITISLSSIDESDLFAMESEWSGGENIFADDIDITHEVGIELRGYCNLECCNEYE